MWSEGKYLKNILFGVTILFSLHLNGQVSMLDDTVKINEVVISSQRNVNNHAGFKRNTIDPSVLEFNNHGSLADVLSLHSNIFIKSYGTGGSATPSFRGTGASQTVLTWNNININSPMLGQTDVSIIPSGMIDDIQIYFGGASMPLNNGGIGGIINLETRPVWKKETLISLSPEIGSFGHYSGLIKVRSGDINFQTVTKAFMQKSENDFRYFNKEIGPEPVWETRRNSQVNQQGLIQEFYYKKSKNIFSARIWYQSAYRNLPSSLLTQQVNAGEKQSDESLRTLMNIDGRSGDLTYFFTGALLLSNLSYSNKLASIDSRNNSETYVLKSGAEIKIDEFTKLKFILSDELSVIKSNNYGKRSSRYTTSVTASAERNNSGRFDASILVREILNDELFLFPDFSLGLQYRLTDKNEYLLKGNISRNSRIPTMNDLFWLPGGNPDLKNEYAYTYELTYEMNPKISSHSGFRFDLSLFRNTIKDMIQWHPGQYSYWTADNIQNVNTTGLESSFSLDYSNNKLRSRFNAGYTFTRAIEGSSNFCSGNQLIYIPKNQLNTSLLVTYGNLYTSWVTTLVGRRYITADNSKYLPDYFLNNLMAGIKIRINDSMFDMNFTVDNIFGINYQTIAYFPLPGRSYSLKLLFQLLK